ncbi:hypothetical protein ACH4TV_14860 [Streptomyces sp. NPDC020898]
MRSGEPRGERCSTLRHAPWLQQERPEKTDALLSGRLKSLPM